jgi:hypothetical protein
MISTVSATLRDDVHFVDASEDAFPMGSMTGAPKVMACNFDKYEMVSAVCSPDRQVLLLQTGILNSMW